MNKMVQTDTESVIPVAVKAGKKARANNPYISGKREWNAQFGRPIAEANWWRVVALVTSVIALVSLFSLSRLGFSQKVVPYVVLVNDLGQTVASGLANTGGGTQDPRVRRSLLSSFIMNVRGVTSDGAAQKERITAAYSMMSGADPAFTVLNEYFQSEEGDPFARAENVSVSAQVSTLLPLSDNTYQIEWREIIRDRTGQEIGNENWQGVITVRTSEVLSDSDILKNPIGLFVQEFNWTKRL